MYVREIHVCIEHTEICVEILRTLQRKNALESDDEWNNKLKRIFIHQNDTVSVTHVFIFLFGVSFFFYSPDFVFIIMIMFRFILWAYFMYAIRTEWYTLTSFG